MTIEDSKDHWAQLAKEADEHADYLEGRGEYAGDWRHKAETYRRTVRSLIQERETGKPHCVCCLKPLK